MNLELAEPVKLGLEDRVGLEIREVEPRDQLGSGIGLAVAVSDDPDRFIQVVEDDREPFQDVGFAGAGWSAQTGADE